MSKGKNFDDKLETKEIAVLLRKWIKESVKRWELPKAKYSVRSDCSCIRVKIKDIPFSYLNALAIAWRAENPHLSMANLPSWDKRRPLYTKAGQQLLDKIKQQALSYQRDDSDMMTDYFDYNFLCFVDFDWEMENRDKEEIKSKLLANKLSEALEA